ncbi:molybdopterin-dependent oxidoreductase [Rhodoferax saidenbachensis]|uniref:Assimilatory nitrate reductase catalytic subunit n=1 Tax=Rhodoferax saidenbachensis TaxID=1484693 RepID=A0ABU1ZQ98_9BURK|nr:molybdopterin-dependent oxidoreductase [Rhodoferax saidenbachensis]MDR7307710.1 assimilatory nitrate reductase catalytic subunit [Rhodoferax saidenbachensis]
MTETRSTCPYCGVGCGVIIESQGAQITGVRGDPDHPANFGRLCSKGSTLHLTASEPVTLQTRLLQPLQRLQRSATPQPVSWDSALTLATDQFARIVRDHGPDAVGFYVSGQLLTEDYYVFNKLAKGLIGTNNIDTNSRLCMSSAVAGYKKTLGADAPPACYDDVNHAQTIFIVGSNTAFAHPILFRRIEDAKRKNPALKIVVADVRRTDTVELADLFLQIQPGTDVMLFNGMLHLMLWEGWTNPTFIAAHTTGFDDLKATVRDYTPDAVAQTCGISKADLLEATRLFAQSPATLSLYCQGLNQSSSGTAKNTALINLHLATGQIGKPGAAPFSLTGQPNAMGGREVGGLANLLSAHRDLANPAHRAEVAALWGVPSVPDKTGKTAVEMFQAAADGEIKALWIACTNPAQSMPDQATVRRALERAEFVVVQEAFSTTATARYADLLLPATTWGEKEGTVTNSERRISRVRAAVVPPGAPDTAPRHDWAIATDFAQRLERALGRDTTTGTLFPYPTAESVWNEHRESTRGRDLDITGMDYAQLDAKPLQWPMPEGASTGKVRLYEDGVFPTPDGRARFVNAEYRGVAEPREARYPFSLTTGRLRDQWHGMSRTGTLGRLFGHVREPVLQMHPQDMARRLIQENDLVHVTSRRGSILVPVQASPEVGLSQAFMAMHWGEEYLSGVSATGTRLAGVNALTTSAYCPDSKQPEFKHAAVKVLKADMPWTLLAIAWLPATEVLAARSALQALMGRFAFASCVPFGSAGDSKGHERSGVLFRAADLEAASDEVLQEIETLLQLNGADVVRYADKKRGQRRAVRLQRATVNATLEGFMLAGDTRAQSWMTTLLQDEQPAQNYGRALLAPGATPPMPVQSRGKVVCTCFNVTDSAIQATLADCTGFAADRLATLQGALKCGTNCGSCVPQLQRMVRASMEPTTA